MTFREQYAVCIDVCARIAASSNDQYDEITSLPTSARSALEAALRTLCCQLTSSTTQQDCNQLYQLIKLTLYLAEQDIIDSGLPFYVIEDAFEQLDIETCETLFTRLQKLSPRLTAESLLLKKNNRLFLLRLCNSLLKRLSKTVKTKFCGAILSMVSSFNTVDERGGLNITGKSNLDNRTVIETSEQMNDLVNDHTSDSVLQQFRVDSHFYLQVWSIQSYFVEPQSMIIKQTGTTSGTQPTVDSNKLQDFVSKLTSIVNAFHHSPISNELNASSPTEDQSHADSTIIPSSFFPKYLSGSRLLNLQLQDPTFRRHVLTQALIFMQYLVINQTSETVKTALASQVNLASSTTKRSAEAKSTADNQTISPSVGKLMDLVRSVVTELQTTCASAKYYECLIDILHAEGAWMNWKKEKAPAISREPVSLADPLMLPVDVSVKRAKKRKLAAFSMMDDVDEARLMYENKFNMGSEACAQLFAVESNMESISGDRRSFLPSLDTLAEPLIDEELDRRERIAKQEEVEDESELQRSNKVLCWRILRAARRADPALFLKSEGSVLEIIKFKIDQRDKQQSEQPVDTVPVASHVDHVTASAPVANNEVVEIADDEADPEDSKLDEPTGDLMVITPSVEEEDSVKVDEELHDEEDSGHRRTSRKDNELLEPSTDVSVDLSVGKADDEAKMQPTEAAPIDESTALDVVTDVVAADVLISMNTTAAAGVPIAMETESSLSS